MSLAEDLKLRKKLARVGFYSRGVALDLLPYFAFERRLQRRLGAAADERILDRVAYYNRLESDFDPAGGTPIGRIKLKHSYYYYDLKQYARYFGRSRRLYYIPGDVTTVPDRPSIVKSRPIVPDNRNSVLMKLDRLRHFSWQRDDLPFRRKADCAVWRGIMNNDLRRALVDRHGAGSRHDIAYTGAKIGAGQPGAFMPVSRQLGFRYILSVEGNDVATNLKWVMASNSLCLMTRPKMETWFMEGRLVPGVHYAELRDDYADLDDTVDHFNRHPGEAEAIIDNAHAWMRQFQNSADEDLISLLVLKKYFEKSGQAVE